MKYEQKHIEEMMHYSQSIGLDTRLISAAKTKKQADELLNLQKFTIEYNAKWLLSVKEQSAQFHDQKKDINSINKKIDSIIGYIEKHYDDALSEEIKQLYSLKERLEMRLLLRLKADTLESNILKGIKEGLRHVGFSLTAITKGSQHNEALIKTFRDILRQELQQ